MQEFIPGCAAVYFINQLQYSASVFNQVPWFIQYLIDGANGFYGNINQGIPLLNRAIDSSGYIHQYAAKYGNA